MRIGSDSYECIDMGCLYIRPNMSSLCANLILCTPSWCSGIVPGHGTGGRGFKPQLARAHKAHFIISNIKCQIK